MAATYRTYTAIGTQVRQYLWSAVMRYEHAVVELPEGLHLVSMNSPSSILHVFRAVRLRGGVHRVPWGSSIPATVGRPSLGDIHRNPVLVHVGHSESITFASIVTATNSSSSIQLTTQHRTNQFRITIRASPYALIDPWNTRVSRTTITC